MASSPSSLACPLRKKLRPLFSPDSVQTHKPFIKIVSSPCLFFLLCPQQSGLYIKRPLYTRPLWTRLSITCHTLDTGRVCKISSDRKPWTYTRMRTTCSRIKDKLSAASTFPFWLILSLPLGRIVFWLDISILIPSSQFARTLLRLSLRAYAFLMLGLAFF